MISRLTIVRCEVKKNQQYMTIDQVKTHDSELQGQEEAAIGNHWVSYLHVAPVKNSQML